MDGGGSNVFTKIVLAMAAVYSCNWMYQELTKTQSMTKSQLFAMAKADSVSKVVIVRDDSIAPSLEVKVYGDGEQQIGRLLIDNEEQFLKELETAQARDGQPSLKRVAVEHSSGTTNPFIIIMIALAVGSLLFLGRGRGASNMRNLGGGGNGMFDKMFSAGKSQATEYGAGNKVNVTFKDVAGLQGAKEEILEVVEFLKNPKKYQEIGAKLPKGVLLVGPPGTGKTLLAKACAGEAGVTFFAASGSEFVEMYVGVGASRVRDLFKRAKAKSPSIIFIDEIDAMGKRSSGINKNDERESTLNQLFVEMDGFGTNTSVIVLAATNRKDALDPALIRPGRFDRIVDITPPNNKEREEIFGVHLKRLKLTKALTLEEVAHKLSPLTVGMSGADIMSICNEAALTAARHKKQSVELVDFHEAYDRVLTGLKRKQPLKDSDRKVLSFHESGHAIAAWFLKYTQQVLKVTTC